MAGQGITVQRNLNFFNVKDYRATGDGTTDDTTAISAANTAAAVSGGVVFFPPGTYISTTQTIQTGVYYMGAGKYASVIKLKNGANADLFSAQTNLINLTAALSSSAQGTLYNFGFSDLTLDGNKANQSSGTSYCLRFYGYSYTMRDLEIRNGYTGNVQADWNSGNNFATDSMEALWLNVKSYNSGGIGIQFGGPHDSQFTQVISFLDTYHDFHLTPNAVGSQLTTCHFWQPNAGMVPLLCEAADVYCNNCQAESGTTIQVVSLGSSFQFIGGSIFGAGANSAAGIQIGQTGGQTPYQGQILQSAGVTTAAGVTRQKIYTRVSNCLGSHGALYLANDGGFSDFNVSADQSSGSYITGTLAASSSVRVIGQGITASGSAATSGQNTISNNANSGFVVHNASSGKDEFAVNTFTAKVDIPNATPMNFYSDNYSTFIAGISYNNKGSCYTRGGFAGGQSATAVAIANAGTITATDIEESRVAPTGNVTGIILQAGTQAGQFLTVVNESAFTITLNTTPATANVSNSDVATAIAAKTARSYRWDSSTALWYPIIGG